MIVNNAVDLRLALERRFASAPRVPDLSENSSLDPASPEHQKWLTRREWREYHAREHIINGMLISLGWHLNNTSTDYQKFSSNLSGEVAVTSSETERKRFLDYFGYDRETAAPLLIVEAKRPSLNLPLYGGDWSGVAQHPTAEAIAIYLHDQDSEHGLTALWTSYLDDVRDYMESVNVSTGEPPKRLVMTNGTWLIIFTSPSDSFSSHPPAGSTSIFVFEDTNVILSDTELLFKLLAYPCVANSVPAIPRSQLRFVIQQDTVQSCMHGLTVLHAFDPRIRYKKVPRLTVRPTLILRSHNNTYVEVFEDTSDFDVPSDTDKEIHGHVKIVAKAAALLKANVEKSLDLDELTITGIKDHYKDELAFKGRQGVKWKQDQSSSGSKVYDIVTGLSPHFINVAKHFRSCSYHIHEKANKESKAKWPDPIGRRKTNPRSLFTDGSSYHCTHADVYLIKDSRVTAGNRKSCGSRSADDHGPFCEIWSFEQHLCCKMCVFEPMCSSSDVCDLPCPTVSLTVTAKSKVRRSLGRCAKGTFLAIRRSFRAIRPRRR